MGAGRQHAGGGPFQQVDGEQAVQRGDRADLAGAQVGFVRVEEGHLHRGGRWSPEAL